MIVQCLKSSFDILLGPFSGVLVELHDAHGGEHPGAAGGQDLVVSHAHPLNNLETRLKKL